MSDATNVNPIAEEVREVAAASFNSRRTLRRNILGLVTALNVVSTIVACAIAYHFQKEAFLNSIDRVLTAGAVCAQHLFGHDFHIRILNDDPTDDMTPAEELEHIKYISDLVDKLHLKYIGALVQRNGKYYYTITSSPQEAIANGTYDHVWTEYRDTTPELAQTFKDGVTRFERHRDKYGLFRSGYVAFSLPGSHKVDYVFVADMSTNYIDEHLRLTLEKTAVAGLAICAVSLWLTWMLANNLAGPLSKLARLIRAVAQHDFQMQPDQRETLNFIASRAHEEVSEVAHAFSRMEERLQNYFCELERTTAEQERTKSELGIAHDIQMGLLPRELPEVPGCDVFARVIPAKEVGGDLFDVAVMDDGRLLLVVADVSGKGISAGLFMAVAKTLLRVGRTHGATAHGIVEFLNDQLSAHNDALMFVTMFLCLFDPKTGELAYSNAGHNPPYIKRLDGRVEPLKGRHGTALGIQGQQSYVCEKTQLEDGDLFLLYTDGITEAQNSREELFSEERLAACLRDVPETGAAFAGTAVIDAVMGFQGSAPQFDDITLVALRYTAPAVVSAPILELASVSA
jgi:sigma-B regulation protein RsbU (phosphoserine phosphatase)